MQDISNQILEKIKKEGISPIPRWKFLVKNYIFWALFGLALTVGGVAFSIMLFMLRMDDWDVYWRLRKTIGVRVLASVPYVWITLIVLLIMLAYYDFINTRKAYRRRTSSVMAGSVIVSLFLGSAFYALGWAEKMDRKLEALLPIYKSGEEKEKEMWDQPEYGLISGEVVEEGPDGEMVIEDFNGDQWNVKEQLETPASDDEDYKKEEDNGDDNESRKTNDDNDKKEKKKSKRVKIVGKKESGNFFVAEEIRTWGDGKDDDDEIENETPEKSEENSDDKKEYEARTYQERDDEDRRSKVESRDGEKEDGDRSGEYGEGEDD